MRNRIAIAMLLMLASTPFALPDDTAVCVAMLDDERVQLADHELKVELAKLRLAAFEKICDLVDGLWEEQAIERMIWLEARHDRDASRLELERARLILERQQGLVERLRSVCGGEGEKAVPEARRRYLQADCEQQAKAVEVARVDLEFAKEWLTSVRALREGSIGTATAQDVILAELDVELEQARLEDATARTKACRGS
jgi:hypothetical protein